MKIKILSTILLTIIIIVFQFSCQKEIIDKDNNLNIDLLQAQLWYENNHPSELVIKSKIPNNNKLIGKPSWDLATINHLKDSKFVEV